MPQPAPRRLEGHRQGARRPAAGVPADGKNAVRTHNGTYGKPGEVIGRQRYPNGRHNFTSPLPREHVDTGEGHCGACEQMRCVQHGDQVVARAQSWNPRVVAEGLEKLASGLDTSSSVGSSGMGVHWPVQDPPGEVRPGAGTTRAATTVGGQGPGTQVAGKAKPRKPAGLWFEPLPAVTADRRRPVAVDRWQLLTRRSPGLVLAALHSSEEHRRVSATVDRRLHTIET